MIGVAKNKINCNQWQQSELEDDDDITWSAPWAGWRQKETHCSPCYFFNTGSIVKKDECWIQTGKGHEAHRPSTVHLTNLIGVLKTRVRTLSEDIKMPFGIDKKDVLEMRRGRKMDSSEIDLPGD